jgi:prepilin-type N-terminal cleavage/methylation domain-containing protein
MLKKKEGFTLIEILIVVAIIAILSSVVLIGLGPTQRAGRDARRISDLRQVQNALELYYNRCGYYPGPTPTAASGPCGSFSQVTSDGWKALTATLTSVNTNIGVSTIPLDPTAGHTYYYGTNGTGSSYIVAATLEDPNNSVFSGYTPPSVTGYTITGSPGTGSTFPSSISSCAPPNYCLQL